VTQRYFLPQLPSQGGDVGLPDSEAHHAVSVMRIKPGAELVLFDGQGNEASATVRSVSRREVRCDAAASVYRPRQNRVRIHLGVAMPKGDRARELVERLTELGVERLTPLHCERSPWETSDSAILKWQRVVVESCKQSRRNRLLRIEPAAPSADWWEGDAESRAAEAAGRGVSWIAHPGGVRLAEAFGQLPEVFGRDSAEDEAGEESRPVVRIAIGPEGGFTTAEAAAAEQAGWTPIGLGETIYRIETAAVLIAAVIVVGR